MPLKVIVRYPRPDIKGTKKRVHKEMTKFATGQLKTWVLNTVDPIPVWSGAARATFLKLAARAQTSLTINPIAPDPPGSRIYLGISETTSELIADQRSGQYGWVWQTTLAHMGIVEDRVGFVSAGFRALQSEKVKLPQPVFKAERTR